MPVGSPHTLNEIVQLFLPTTPPWSAYFSRNPFQICGFFGSMRSRSSEVLVGDITLGCRA